MLDKRGAQSVITSYSIHYTKLYDDLKFEILSSSGSKDIVHSMGNIIQIKNINTTAQRLSVKDIKSKCTHMMANGEFYNRFASMGIIYGPFFKPIEQVWGNPREALGSIRLPDGLEKETGRYIFHPSIIVITSYSIHYTKLYDHF